MKCRYPIRDWTPSSPDRRNRRELTEPKCWLCPAVSNSAESSACCPTALSKRAACSVRRLLLRRQATWPLLVCRGGSCVVVGKRQGPCPAIRRRWTRLRPPIQYRPSSDLRLLLYVNRLSFLLFSHKSSTQLKQFYLLKFLQNCRRQFRRRPRSGSPVLPLPKGFQPRPFRRRTRPMCNPR